MLIPVILLVPRPRLVVPLGVVLGSVGVSLLLLDSLVFAENRYHLERPDRSSCSRRRPGPFSPSTSSWALAIEAMLAGWVWQRTALPPARRIGRYLALGLGGLLRGQPPRPRVGRGALRRAGDLVHPLPAALLTARGPPALLAKLGLVDRARAREQASSPPSAGRPTASCATRSRLCGASPARPRLNVLLVVIDAHARRCAHGRRRAAARRVRARRDPVRPSTTAAATRRGPACSRCSTASPRPTGTPSPTSPGRRW